MKSRPLGKDPVKTIQGVVMPEKLATGKRRSMEDILASQGLMDDDFGSKDDSTSQAEPSTQALPSKETSSATSETDSDRSERVEIPVDQIRPGKYQPRRIFDQEKLEELADSILTAGRLTNPVTIRPLEDGTYELITGERRWRAHQILGWKTISANIRYLSDGAAQILALTDNTDAEPLTAYEEARALKDLLDNQVATSNSDLARKTGRNKATIGRQLSFFSLPPSVIAKLDDNPLMLSQRAATDLAPSAESYPHVVEEAVELIEAGKLEGSRAGEWARKKIRSLTKKTVPTFSRSRVLTFNGGYEGLTRAKIQGKKITLECSGDSDPHEVLADLAKALGITASESEIELDEQVGREG